MKEEYVVTWKETLEAIDGKNNEVLEKIQKAWNLKVVDDKDEEEEKNSFEIF